MMYLSRNGTRAATPSAPWYRIRLKLFNKRSARLYALLVLASAGLALLAGACGSKAPAPAPAPPGTQSSSSSSGSAPGSSSIRTVGVLADSGKGIFASRCAKCHGERGQGVFAPAIIGTNATLEKFDTAQGLYDFVRVAMPGDAPGTLPDQEYLEVISYLLNQNGFVASESEFALSHLTTYVLKNTKK